MPDLPGLAAALSYAARGWKILALWWPTPDGCSCGTPNCGNIAKHPYFPLCPNGVHSSTSDPDTIRSWFAKVPEINIGIAGGQESGLWILDIDPRHGGHVTLEELETKHGKLPTSLRARTGSGGSHIFWKHPGDGRLSNSAGRLGPGLDVRADGGYVCGAPSMHASGNPYAWEDEDSSVLEAAPNWLLELIGERYQDDTGEIPEAFEPVPDDQGEIIARTKLHRAIKRMREGLSRHQTAVWLFQQCHDNKVSRPVAALLLDPLLAVANERPGDRNVSRAELSKALTWAYKSRTRDPDPSILPRPVSEIAAIHSDIARHQAIKAAAESARVPVSAVRAEVQKARSIASAPPPDDWRSRLLWKETKDGRSIEACLHNAEIILTYHEDWAGHIQQNVFSDAPESHSGPISEPSGRWTDTHTAQATAWLQSHCRLMVSTDLVHIAVSLAAKRSPVHPVKDYLSKLKWDGTERLKFWLEDFCEAERTPYHQDIGRKWLISGAARIMEPGCQADAALILEGPQGSKKSTLFRRLFEPWFSDDIEVLGSKDSSMQLQGIWGLEIAELDSLHRSEITRVKAFLSRRVDRFRPPYGKMVIEWPRQNIFAGSTNRDTYLADDTGARRFWCVRCGSLDPEGLAAARDQLWAEALAAHLARDPHWLTDDSVIAAAAAEQEARYTTDTWEEQVENALDSWNPLHAVTTATVMAAIGIDTARQGRAEQMRTASCLVRLGYARRRQMVNGKKLYTWGKGT